MELAESLDIVIGRSRHDRYRWLCGDGNPDAESRLAYRDRVIRLATATPPESDAARAARLTAEFPPDPSHAPRRCCE